MAAHLSASLMIMSLFLAKCLLLGRKSGILFTAEYRIFRSHSKKVLLDGGIQVDLILKLGSHVAPEKINLDKDGGQDRQLLIVSHLYL